MRETVTFYSGQGLRLGGILFLPANYDRQTKYPVIVHCPGFRHGLEEYGFRIEPMMKTFNHAGYMALYFHCRGFGLSEGARYRSIPIEQIEDIRSAISYVQTRPDVDADQIGLFGISLGGATAPYAAALDDRVRCTVAATGFGDGEEWLRGLRREAEWQEFSRVIREDQRQKAVSGKSKLVAPEGGTNDAILILDPDSRAAEANLLHLDSELARMRMPLEVAQAIVDFKPVDIVHRISPRPILYVAAEMDSLCPARGIVQMYAKTSTPKDLVILKGQTHRSVYTFPDSSSYKGDPWGGRELMRVAVDYFDRHLRQGNSPGVVKGERGLGSRPSPSS